MTDFQLDMIERRWSALGPGMIWDVDDAEDKGDEIRRDIADLLTEVYRLRKEADDQLPMPDDFVEIGGES